MYEAKDKNSAIREIQIYLEYLTDETVYIAPSGIYDERTKAAVIDFQEKNGLPKSGTVDYATHTALYDAYLAEKKREIIRLDGGAILEFPVKKGDSYDGITSINRIISTLSEHYRLEPMMNDGGYFSEETARSVRELREIYLFDDGDYIDELLYSRMQDDVDSISKAKNDFFKVGE